MSLIANNMHVQYWVPPGSAFEGRRRNQWKGYQSQGGSLPTTRALSLPALAPSNLLRHTATNTKDKYTNIHWFKYTNIYGFKYTNIHGFKYTNTWTTMVALASIVSVSLVVLAKLTLQNIEYFSIRTLWASLATKNPHHLFADSLADSH